MATERIRNVACVTAMTRRLTIIVIFIMEEIQVCIPGPLDGMVIRKPENCYSPFIYPTPNCKVEKRRIGAEPYCKAVHKSHPECDCRWCVFHKEFNKAKGKESEVLAQIINP